MTASLQHNKSAAEMAVSVLLLLLLLLLLGLTVGGLGGRANAADDKYLIGAGRYDVTGPAAEIEMVCVCVQTLCRELQLHCKNTNTLSLSHCRWVMRCRHR